MSFLSEHLDAKDDADKKYMEDLLEKSLRLILASDKVPLIRKIEQLYDAGHCPNYVRQHCLRIELMNEPEQTEATVKLFYEHLPKEYLTNGNLYNSYHFMKEQREIELGGSSALRLERRNHAEAFEAKGMTDELRDISLSDYLERSRK